MYSHVQSALWWPHTVQPLNQKGLKSWGSIPTNAKPSQTSYSYTWSAGGPRGLGRNVKSKRTSLSYLSNDSQQTKTDVTVGGIDAPSCILKRQKHLQIEQSSACSGGVRESFSRCSMVFWPWWQWQHLSVQWSRLEPSWPCECKPSTSNPACPRKETRTYTLKRIIEIRRCMADKFKTTTSSKILGHFLPLCNDHCKLKTRHNLRFVYTQKLRNSSFTGFKLTNLIQELPINS